MLDVLIPIPWNKINTAKGYLYIPGNRIFRYIRRNTDEGRKLKYIANRLKVTKHPQHYILTKYNNAFR